MEIVVVLVRLRAAEQLGETRAQPAHPSSFIVPNAPAYSLYFSVDSTGDGKATHMQTHHPSFLTYFCT